jgi:large subunit ribosomal protein L21
LPRLNALPEARPFPIDREQGRESPRQRRRRVRDKSQEANMFAVIKTGGKQYRVAENDIIRIEKLGGDAGDAVAFEEVLMVAGEGEPSVGAPFVEGATVTGEVVGQGRARKVIVFKKKRRQGYRRTAGHRQYRTDVRITAILTGGAKPPAPKAKAAAPAPKAEAPKLEASKPEASKPEASRPAPAAEGDALFATPAGPADDLKKISGVGPVLEKKLNALGITQFAQIAAFSADDIARVDDSLNFKGRIERDDWISQATALAEAAKG